MLACGVRVKTRLDAYEDTSSVSPMRRIVECAVVIASSLLGRRPAGLVRSEWIGHLLPFMPQDLPSGGYPG